MHIITTENLDLLHKNAAEDAFRQALLSRKDSAPKSTAFTLSLGVEL